MEHSFREQLARLKNARFQVSALSCVNFLGAAQIIEAVRIPTWPTRKSHYYAEEISSSTTRPRAFTSASEDCQAFLRVNVFFSSGKSRNGLCRSREAMNRPITEEAVLCQTSQSICYLCTWCCKQRPTIVRKNVRSTDRRLP